MRFCLSLRLALIHANTNGPIQLKCRTKLADKPRSNIGLLPFKPFPPFQDGDRLYSVMTTTSYKLYLIIINNNIATFYITVNGHVICERIRSISTRNYNVLICSLSY